MKGKQVTQKKRVNSHTFLFFSACVHLILSLIYWFIFIYREGEWTQTCPFHFGKGGDSGRGDGGYFGSFFHSFCMCIASGLPKGSRGMVQEIKQALGWCNNHFDISYCYLIVFGLWCRLQSVQLLMWDFTSSILMYYFYDERAGLVIICLRLSCIRSLRLEWNQ